MILKQVFIGYDPETFSRPACYQYFPSCGHQLHIRSVEGRQRAVCPECRFIQFKNPFPAVSIAAFQNGLVLLGQRKAPPGAGKWALPIGYVDYEEDFLSAAVREMREETGLEVQIRAILNITSSLTTPDFHFLGIYLSAVVTGGKLEARDDLIGVRWFDLSAPLPETAFEEDRQILACLQANPGWGLPVAAGHIQR